ncbi:MAG: GTP-binding protein [Rhizobiales bacterium 65-79]|jgi:G3E family GTPase|nr:GTP-binding protein [Hyphomicrobiales bacterium]OJU03868.1 MAG: GTP-binding protein [Rhizobiales bacterium 65-79]
MSTPDGSLVPVTILTGFLGSGKTTLLNRLLRRPALQGAAVIVNEFGEIGLDHLLIEASEEQFALLDNGCICCTVRGDLVGTLKELDRRSREGETPPLTQVLIETTGLADPAPILHTLMAEPELGRVFRIGSVLTTVDVVNGLATLERHPEAAKQAALADRLIVTKTDLADGEAVRRLEARLAALAPAAALTRALNGEADFDLLERPVAEPGAEPERLAGWFDEAVSAGTHECAAGHRGHAHAHPGEHHLHGIRSYSFVIDQPIEWSAFAQWLEYVAALKGEDLLRLKGLVHVTDDPDRPLLLNGVQHVFHPPARLDRWPSADRRTRLVFIVRDIAPEAIEHTLVKFAAVNAASIHPPQRSAAA